MPARLSGSAAATVMGGSVVRSSAARAGLAERVDGFGQGELLAEGAGDEAAAADFSASFEAAEDGGEVAPLGGVGLAGEEVAEEHAVAAEQDAGVGVECGVVAAGGGDGLLALVLRRAWASDVGVSVGAIGVAEQRPAAGGGAGGGAFAQAGGGGLRDGDGFAARVHHGAELVEAVGGGEAGGGEFPERGGGLQLGEAAEALEVGDEGCAAVGEERRGFVGPRRRAIARGRLLRRTWRRARGAATRLTRGGRR